MTIIAGIIDKENERVIIGGDSLGVGGLDKSVMANPKVFKVGKFVIGCTTSFRMIQLIQFSFKPKKKKKDQDIFEYMCTEFVDSLRETFKKGGFLQKYTDGDEKGGEFLVGYKDRLFRICSDFQVEETTNDYNATGCGDRYALGSFHSTSVSDMDAIGRLYYALGSACKHSAGCQAPYVFEATKVNELEKEHGLQNAWKHRKLPTKTDYYSQEEIAKAFEDLRQCFSKVDLGSFKEFAKIFGDMKETEFEFPFAKKPVTYFDRINALTQRDESVRQQREWLEKADYNDDFIKNDITFLDDVEVGYLLRDKYGELFKVGAILNVTTLNDYLLCVESISNPNDEKYNTTFLYHGDKGEYAILKNNLKTSSVKEEKVDPIIEQQREWLEKHKILNEGETVLPHQDLLPLGSTFFPKKSIGSARYREVKAITRSISNFIYVHVEYEDQAESLFYSDLVNTDDYILK